MNHKFLFVCSANKQRSNTASDYFSKKYPTYEYYSAGTNIKICQSEGTNLLEEADLEWADVIFVMEQKHNVIIQERFTRKYQHKIIVLNIRDVYKYYQKELIHTLEEKTKAFFI